MMEKKCTNCRHYKDKKCYSEDFNKTIQFQDNNNLGYTYTEEGYLDENVRENIDIKELIDIVIEELKKQDYIKKTKNTNKFNWEETTMEAEIMEHINLSLSSGIENYFNNLSAGYIIIEEPTEFNCKFWE